MKVDGGGYDPEKGEYVEGETTRETLPCHLSPLGIDRTATLFGSMEQRVTVARLMQRYTKSFDRVEIDGETFSVKRPLHKRRRSVFYLEG